MRTAGVFLIFGAVALRGVVVFAGDSRLGAIFLLLAAYGLLLLAETWISRRPPSLSLLPLWESDGGKASIPASDGVKATRKKHYLHALRGLRGSKDQGGVLLRLLYLFLQSTLAIVLLVLTGYEDFFAMLFIPLSLSAVAFFGKSWGLVGISALSLALTSTLLSSDVGLLFGLVMGILYSGICFLFGGYALQVLKAEAAHEQNRRTFDELQIAHYKLQGYADQVVSLISEQERNRLARDLHDSVTQTVFSMNLAAQSARLLVDRSPPRAAGQLLRLEELAAHAQGEIQSLVSQLKPPSLAEEGLPAALRRLADERKARDSLQVSLEVQGEGVLSEIEAVGLVAIANEALTNIAKHSGVFQAAIHLNLEAGKACLEIEDRGAGFDLDVNSIQRGHLGLAGMAERAGEIGWSLSVESQPGWGTRIRILQKQAGVMQ